MSLVRILNDRRRMLGLSQAQVAKRAGISIPTLRELENDQGTIRSLTAVLAVLDLRWAWTPSSESPVDVLGERRKSLGILQAEMARRVGCSRITILNLEKTFVGRVDVDRHACLDTMK